MRTWDLHALNTRNRVMLIVCWCLTAVGVLSTWLVTGPAIAVIVMLAGIFVFILPTVLVWMKIGDRYIMYYITIVSSFAGYWFAPIIEVYMLTMLFSAILSLYYDYRPVILMGISNVIYTIYFVYHYYEPPLYDHIMPFVSIQVVVTATLATQSIIGEKLRSNSLMMERLSKTDALTGLYNHKEFYEQLEYAIREYREGRLHQLQLAVLDIDNFKNINDTFGHSIGDLIIRRVSEVIQSQTTRHDIVARYGGEEFTIIFKNKTIAEAYTIVEKIRMSLAAFPHPETKHQPVTVSIGLQEATRETDKSELFSQADQLLYKAKRDGKNRTFVGH